MNKQVAKILYIISGILVIIGVVFYIRDFQAAPYLFSAGVAGWLIYRLLIPYKGNNIRYKRLQNMFYISSVLQVVTAYAMFVHEEYWGITLTISVILDLYVSFIMPSAQEKNASES